MKYKRKSSVRYSYTRHDDSCDYSVFIYNPETGRDYIFNNIAAFIWEQLGDWHTISMIIDCVHDVGISIDRDVATQDTEKLFSIFSNHGLIECEQ